MRLARLGGVIVFCPALALAADDTTRVMFDVTASWQVGKWGHYVFLVRR